MANDNGAAAARCFACGARLTASRRLVTCEDDQTVHVGPERWRKIRGGDTSGWQPPKGGPRLYLLSRKPGVHP